MVKQMTEPKLEAPGAGIPFINRMVAKYFILPKLFKKSWEEANTHYQKQLEAIAVLAMQIPEHKRTQRVLVKRIQGLEDSSRYWSAQMVLEHICIVSEGMGNGIIELSKNSRPNRTASTAAVKPLGQESFEKTWERYQRLVQTHVKEINSTVKDRTTRITFDHPWFGGFNAHQWNWMLGIHTGIHRTQLKEIKTAL